MSEPVVFVVDDDPGMRDSTSALLDSAGLRSRTFEAAEQFLNEYSPDTEGCLVLDLHMPGISGTDLIERMRAKQYMLPVLVVSGTGTIPVAVQVMKLGIVDFLEKPVDPRLLIAKVRAALELDVSRRADAASLAQVRQRLSQLTVRERELLQLLVSGSSNKQIASQLGISVKTVENHRAHIMAKTGAANAADLVRISMLASSSEPAAG